MRDREAEKLLKESRRGKKKRKRNWVSTDCMSGQLHMVFIKVLTLWEQLHTALLIFVIRPITFLYGGHWNIGLLTGQPVLLSVTKMKVFTNLNKNKI